MTKINKGQVNGKKFSYDDDGLRDAIAYATKLMRDKKAVDFQWHDEYEKSLSKEGGNGGGGAASSGSFGGGAGTVFTSTNSGIFSPTYGGGGRKKKKKKKSAVEKLGDFVTDNSPERKMVKEYKNRETVFPSGETINPQIPRVDYKKRWGSNEYDSLAAGGSKDKESQDVPELDEETEDIPFK
jgi:hypothetical protein